MKKGFTLAEVLITLGIIGIVAALTIPTLISNHNKKVVSTSLKKFVNTVLVANEQANLDNGIIGNDGYKARGSFEINNPEAAEEMVIKYYKPYMSIISIKKGTYGVFVYLQDGSAFYFRRIRNNNNSDDWSGTYLWLCPKAKSCSELGEDDESLKNALGKKIFVLYPDGNITWAINYYSRNEKIEFCKSPRYIFDEGCTALIVGDGFEVSKDYPIRL